MKKNKFVVLICCLFICLSFYGQTNDSLQNVNSVKSNFFNSGFSKVDQPFVPKKLNIQTNASTLVLYNKTTNLYDNYVGNNDSYGYSSSNTMFRNKSNFFTTLFLGNASSMENNTLLPNRSLLLKDDNYIIRDSFNPNGASNFSEAVIGGVLNLIFN
ncbi:hypothetical protein LB465_02880 [Salegentibacter sp. LM13S]|uniref:hypothetical protein n=1 Tax=Salegentibacter lacus TaxID=2873599 RepID=UPI001CCF9A45|nr:hypothetical protein [Salegentibacter lacus]MBZ9629710.1 hypothetical protein [Salegentibacter lacus]